MVRISGSIWREVQTLAALARGSYGAALNANEGAPGGCLDGSMDEPHGLRECMIVDDVGDVRVPGMAIEE